MRQYHNIDKIDCEQHVITLQGVSSPQELTC